MKTHVLAIDGVDWLSHDNGSKHKTSPYELVAQKKACIVRRGDIMNLTLKCRDRAFDLNKDRISLTFEFGINPSVVKGKHFKITVEIMYIVAKNHLPCFNCCGIS